jgi:cysteine-rich repeat protein
VVQCPPTTEHAGKQEICILDHCGNGFFDPGEACDDGNQIAGDGCSQDCRSAEICGNGIVDFTVGEVCDDGDTRDDDTCCGDCRSCLELAVDLHAMARIEVHEPPVVPACDAAELQRALADLDAARSRADHAMAQASQAIERAHAGSRHEPPMAPTQHDAGDAQERIQELMQRNAELLAELQAVQERLARVETRPPNGRSERLH